MRRQSRIPYRWIAAAGALALGEAVGLVGCRWAAFWPLAAAASALTSLYGFGLAWRRWGVVAFGLAGLALALRFESGRAELLLAAENGRGPFVVELDVTEVPQVRGGWASFRSEVSGVQLEVVLPVGAFGVPGVGDRWRVAGWLERKDRSDRRCRTVWVKGRGTFAARVGDMRFGACYRFAEKVRRRLSAASAKGLVERSSAAGLHRAMLLGERSRLAKSDRETFIAAGTMHVFAISGLHVGVVALVIVTLLVMVFVPLRLAGALMVPILWAYVFLIGLPPSAVRAALMASCYFLAPVLWRRSDAFVAWSQAFVIVHVADPGALVSVGSLLSFSIMLTILAYDRWADAMSLSGGLRSVGLVFAIWAAGAPIAAVVFGRLTPGGMLANLLVVPLAGVSVACGFLGTVFCVAFPVLGVHFNNAAALATDAMRGVSAAVASLPGSCLETVSWSFGWCVCWYLALLAGAAVLLGCRRYGLFGRMADAWKCSFRGVFGWTLPPRV